MSGQYRARRSQLTRLQRPRPAQAHATPAQPLPKGCGGGLPPGVSTVPCSISGAVIVNGAAHTDVTVTLEHASSANSLTVYTVADEPGAAPSFHAALNLAPLFAQPGDVLRMSAMVESIGVVLEHTVLPGHQQVDLVLPLPAGQHNATAPIATIVKVTPHVVTIGETVTLYGQGAPGVQPSPALTYAWYLNAATTPFATTAAAALDTTDLPPGPHTISFAVGRAEHWSARQQVTIDVLRPERTWTLMLYLAGDSADLERFLGTHEVDGALTRLTRLYRESPPQHVAVVALYDGPTKADSALWFFPRGGGVQAPEQRAELAMDAPQTLTAFVTEAQRLAPADAYYLAIADHGNGLDGMAWDQTSDPHNNAYLTNSELQQALQSITAHGAQPIDILHLDACLMGLTEVAYQLRGMANYLICSQSLAWSVFDYAAYALAAQQTPLTAELATRISRQYAETVAERNYPYTIATLDLTQIEAVTMMLNAFTHALNARLDTDQRARTTLHEIRRQVQKLDANGDLQLAHEDEYVDLAHFIELTMQAFDEPEMSRSGSAVQQALQQLILMNSAASGWFSERHKELGNARGLGIYFPSGPHHAHFFAYPQAFDFTLHSTWDEFLQKLYRPFAPLSRLRPAPRPVAPLPFYRPGPLLLP